MEKIIECVPNFSEGRDQNKINAITEEIKKVYGVKFLDAESDKNHNRTVVTFAGAPEVVFDAAFAVIKKAAEIIDMSRHRGEHPRVGATDVCPFIPVSGATMDECVELAKKLGKKVGEELKIPVYLYEKAQPNSLRKTLPQIRQGEYEGLAEKMKLAEWQPDFGPKEFNPKTGAVIIGARKFLIAFNVNLDTADLNLAKKIAGQIRESGIKKNGLKIPGEFKELKALGLAMQNFVQISMNLTDYEITNMNDVYEKIKKLAEKDGSQIKSSEIVGVVPLKAMLKAGQYYAPQVKTKEESISAAVKNMKLDAIEGFNPDKKIIEYMI